MKIESYPIDSVKPCSDSCCIDAATIRVVAWSIRKIGFINPILLDAEGVVIAGHVRLAAARSLGMAKVPVVIRADLSPAQVRTLCIEDEKVTTLFDRPEEDRSYWERAWCGLV